MQHGRMRSAPCVAGPSGQDLCSNEETTTSQALTKVASTHKTEWFRAPDHIFVGIPEPGYEDSLEAARANAATLRSLAHDLGRKCGIVIVMGNLISQDAGVRQAYAEGVPQDRIYGVALVAANPLARAVPIPVQLVDPIEEGVRWLGGLRGT
jgi:hypothetical protein